MQGSAATEGMRGAQSHRSEGRQEYRGAYRVFTLARRLVWPMDCRSLSMEAIHASPPLGFDLRPAC